MKLYYYDIETFKECFVYVAKDRDTGEYHTFAISKVEDQSDQLMQFLKENRKQWFLGYNNLAFDSQIVEAFYRGELKTPAELYELGQEIIEIRKDPDNIFWTPYDRTSFNEIDIYKINHYDRMQKATSLKWLEFAMRRPKMADLPYKVDKKITSETHVKKIITYCKDDVDATEDFVSYNTDELKIRKEAAVSYRSNSFLNKSESAMVEAIFKKLLSKELGTPENRLKGLRKKKKEIKVKDLIFDYVEFSNPEFNSVLEFFKSLHIKAKDGEFNLNGVVDTTLTVNGVTYDYGLGGIHAFREPGVYLSDDTHVIKTVDVKSYYPNLAIRNKFFPEHLSAKFCNVYEDLYNKRLESEKGTAMNYILKIVLNAGYGKSQNKHSVMYDPEYTLKTTINGQLLLTMLADICSSYGDIICLNTDGLEILIPREKEFLFTAACKGWEDITGLTLEYDEYDKLIMRDVNNYIAQFSNGQVKRKGCFMIYEDYNATHGPHFFHKNPSSTIVPLSLQEYYINGTPVEETIKNHDVIWDYLIGKKKTRSFFHVHWIPHRKGSGVKPVRYDERAIRYYASTDGGSLYKHWHDGRITGLESKQLVTMALNIRNDNISKFQNIDYEYYINEANKIIDQIDGKPN